MGKPIDLVQGTLDFLILKAIEPRTEARLGHRQADSADIRRRVEGPAGIALSGALPAGASGVDRCARRADRLRPAGEVLCAHPFRPRASQERNRDLGSAVGSHQSRDPGDVGRSSEELRPMMRWFYVARDGVRSLFARRAFDDQLDADLQFHSRRRPPSTCARDCHRTMLDARL